MIEDHLELILDQQNRATALIKKSIEFYIEYSMQFFKNIFTIFADLAIESVVFHCFLYRNSTTL